MKSLDLSHNSLLKWEELSKLKPLTTVESLNLAHNPFLEVNKEVYMYQLLNNVWEWGFKTLKTINGHPVTQDMRQQTVEWQKETWRAKVAKLKEEIERKEREDREKEDKKDKD